MSATNGGIQQVRMFPGGLWSNEKILRKVLVTLRPKIAGRVSSLSLALSFVELDAVVILHSFATEQV